MFRKIKKIIKILLKLILPKKHQVIARKQYNKFKRNK